MNRDHADSSNTRSGSSHSAAWWMLTLLALPLLYILSMPPLCFGTLRATGRALGDEPEWMLTAIEPYRQFQRIRPFTQPLNAYANWWFGVWYPNHP